MAKKTPTPQIQTVDGRPCIVTMPEQMTATMSAITGQIASLSALSSQPASIIREVEALKQAHQVIQSIIDANNFNGPILVGYPQA